VSKLPSPVNAKIKRRAVALALVISLVFGGYSLRLFQIQIVEGAYYRDQITQNITLVTPLKASRGEILDRSMRPMAINRTSYQVIIDGNFYPYNPYRRSETLCAKQNEIILGLTKLLADAGEIWEDSLPISREAPYVFLPERESSIERLKSDLRLADYATAENCINALVEKYYLGDYSPDDQRVCAGIQREMDLPGKFSYRDAYIFADDVSKNTTYQIDENKQQFPGVGIQPAAVRNILSGTIAPHMIGTVGPIYDLEEYTELKDKGYALNDTLGKSGVEAAFESELRGKNGKRTLIKDPSNVVIDSFESEPPVPGKTVVLTLDSDLQQACDQALDDRIQMLRAQPPRKDNYYDVSSGAVVILDVKDGGLLAASSWPVYDLGTYRQDYEQLIKDPEKPLFNRALNGTFPCGSTMKPNIALSALTCGIITPSSTVTCNYAYHFYSPPSYCMHSHGTISVRTALTRSCNIFFYDVGRRLGMQKMNEYSTLCGLGQKTGLEINESAGVLAGPETYTNWTPGMTIQAAIGQANNAFTPIQLAAYTMTMANRGVRYQTHILRSYLSYDGTEIPYEPKVAARADWTEEAMQAVHEGMLGVTKPGGTAVAAFSGVKYTLAAKTGTAQTGNPNKSDHGLFIAYAPAENPEIAIAVILENGGSRNAGFVARDCLDAYFNTKSNNYTPTPEGVLLP